MVNIGETKQGESCGAHFINYETGVKPEIAPGVAISGVIDCIHRVKIDRDVFTGHDVMILTGSHNYRKFGEDRKREGGGGPIYIEEGAWIATRAIIIGPCRIGKHSVVGAGSVVTHDVPPYTVVAGNPAKVIKTLSPTSVVKKPIAFYTIGSGKYYDCAIRLKNSFYKFHKDIPFHIFGNDAVSAAKADGYDWGRNYAYFGSILAEEYETVVHLDADCVVTGYLTELMEGDWEVAGCLNFGNMFIEQNDLWKKPVVGDIPYSVYVTAGITAAKSELFWKTWKHGTFTKYNNFQGFKDHNPLMIEQDIYNLIFYSRQFKVGIVDKPTFGVYYGTQIRERWGDLYMEGDKIMLGRVSDKGQVKLIHIAGGQGIDKLDYRKMGIPEEVCKRLDYLIS